MKPVNTDSLYHWIANRTGLAVALLDRPSFAQHIRERMSHWELEDEASYVDLLRRQPDELQRIVEMVAVPETWLFRYPRSFAFLADHLRAYRVDRVSPRLRLLSVACATGEEAYSLAITAAYAGWPLTQVTVDAIDCQSGAIMRAQQSTYDLRSMRGDLPDWAREWLTIEGDQVKVESAVARTVHFRCDDVLQMQMRGAPYDAIFCRNLLIYFNAAARHQLIRKLSDWLLPGALLFLGHAERAEYVSEYFQRLDAPHAFAWKRRSDTRAVEPASLGRPTDSATDASPARQRTRVDGVPSHAQARRAVVAQRSVGRDRPEPEATLPSDAVAVSESKSISGPLEPSVVDNASALDAAVRLADSGDLTGALELAKRHVLTARPNVDAYQLLGTLYAALQDFDQAREAFEKVVYLQPNHEEALLQLAMIYGRDGHQDKAARYRRRAARAHRNAQA